MKKAVREGLGSDNGRAVIHPPKMSGMVKQVSAFKKKKYLLLFFTPYFATIYLLNYQTWNFA